MAENEILITRIRTESGDLRIDYNALANLPDLELMMAAKQDVATAITKENIITYLENKTVASAQNAQNAQNAENATNADKLDGHDASEFALAEHSHGDFLPISGGSLTGQVGLKGMVLTEGIDYGTEFPSDATVGRIFFLELEE